MSEPAYAATIARRGRTPAARGASARPNSAASGLCAADGRGVPHTGDAGRPLHPGPDPGFRSDEVPRDARGRHHPADGARTPGAASNRRPHRGEVRASIRALSSADRADARSRADEQWRRATEYAATILVHGDPRYPERVYASNNPVPVLYVRGDPTVWARRGAVAVVGSRGTRDPYADYARRLATAAAHRGMLVVSGFALGADSIGHKAARDAGGRTLCVMPCGLDTVFPPENSAPVGGAACRRAQGEVQEIREFLSTIVPDINTNTPTTLQNAPSPKDLRR